MNGAVRSQKRQRRIPASGAFRGSAALLASSFWTSGFQNRERIYFHFCKLPSLWQICYSSRRKLIHKNQEMLCVTNIIIISLSLLFGLTQTCTQILPIPNKAPLPKLLNEFIFEQLIRSGASSNKKCKDIYTVESPSSVSVPFLFLSGNPLLLIF